MGSNFFGYCTSHFVAAPTYAESVPVTGTYSHFIMGPRHVETPVEDCLVEMVLDFQKNRTAKPA